MNFVAVEPQKVVLPSSLGFRINPQNTAGAGVPRINLRSLFNLGFSSNGPQPRVDTTYQLTDNFSKIIGKHSLKMGFEGRSFMVANPFYGNNNGQFSFNTTATHSTGITGLDFLLGIPATYAQSSGGHIDATAKELYAYFQDQWRIKNNLTVTLGTGYLVDTP
ncbi:MAG: TonB-dependent receptor, partial [Acidobacteria bacterium]